MEQLKKQFEQAKNYISQIQEKLAQGVFLSAEDQESLLRELDVLRTEQERVERLLEGYVLPPAVTVELAEELLERSQAKRERIAQLRQVVADFQSVRSLEDAFRGELSVLQEKLSGLVDPVLERMDQTGELESYRSFLACIRLEHPGYEDISPLIPVFGTAMPLAIMSKKLVLPEGETPTPETVSVPFSPTEEAISEEVKTGKEPKTPEEPENPGKLETVRPPLSKLTGTLQISGGRKQPKGIKALKSLCTANPGIKLVIYQLIFGQYFLSPDHLLYNFPGQNMGLFLKSLAVLLKEGYLTRYTLDTAPEQELYGATPLGRPLLQKALEKGRTPANARDGGTWARMETAADFIRGYEGRRWFSKLFADDPAFFAAYSEITGACIIKLTATEEENIQALILPAAIFTEEDPEEALDGLAKEIGESVKKAEGKLKVFLALSQEEELAGWEAYLRPQLPEDAEILWGFIGKDEFRAPDGTLCSLSEYITQKEQKPKEVPEETGEAEETEREAPEVPPETSEEDEEIPSTEPKQNRSAEEKEKSALTEELQNQYQEDILGMLVAGKTYCATAYLETLARRYPEYQPFRMQLAYALNDPLADCAYSSDKLFQVYFSGNSEPIDALVVSATLRSCFFNQCGYDYQLDQLWDAVAKHPLLEANVALNQVLYQLKEFKSTYHRGIDFYADYRQKKREAFEQSLSAVRAEAQSLYQNNVLGRTKERASQKRFLETKKLIFSPQGELAEYLDAVRRDDREVLELLEDFLCTWYIKDGEEIDSEAIDSGKLNRVLDEAWEVAGSSLRLVKRSSDLMGSLRTNLSKLLRRVVMVLCNYAAILSANTTDENDPGLAAYKRGRSPLLRDLQGAAAFEAEQPAGTPADQAGRAVLLATLDELRQRLDGTFEEEANRYFYLPFLQWDEVLLDEDCFPMLNNVQEMDELSVPARIKRHFAKEERPLEERLREILEARGEWGDDYGSARLILEYLRGHPHLVRNRELLELDPEQDMGFADPAAFLEGKRKEFAEYLELAQSYGQIDNLEGDQKEVMLQIMNGWFDWTQETHNFGFCKKVFNALRGKIEKGAIARAQDLTTSLAVYQKEHPKWEEEEFRDVILEIQERIQVQNYTAAEDLLNRLNAKDLDMELTAVHADYLQEFLREYSVNARKAGSAGSNLETNLVRERNKDDRGANHLIKSWPKGTGTPAARIQDLLADLGFRVKQVQPETPIHGKDHYQVYLSRESEGGQRSDYKHPVSVFGSEAESSGFRLVNIFGRMDASRLIDTFREIGDAKNTLILLDYALTLADRRELARRTKAEFHEKTFAVIDRVVLVYLASHYSETAVNRMLMSVIMPFAACRLYQPNSSQAMPPELFIGRKSDLEKIKAPNGVNIVYGGRQLGKTALLRKAQKDIDRDENGDRAVWIDIKFKDYREAARKISAALYDEGILKTEHITDNWDELARDIKNRLRDTRDPIPYLLLLLDEADAFIESCGAVKFQPFDALKDIQGVGANRFKFVVAGLHNVVRFQRDLAISDNVSLTHLSALTVTPFKYKEARELLEVPLSYLGFRFPDNEETARLVSTIFTTTNYFPGLLQLYCSKLIESLQRGYAGYSESEVPPYVVKEDLIKKVLSDESLLEQIQDKFDITIRVDKSQDDYYYLIALLAAYYSYESCNQEGFSPDDMIQIASEYEIWKLAKLPRPSVEALMEEMQELNILKRLGNNRYRFARFRFREMMGSKQAVDDKILSYGEED